MEDLKHKFLLLINKQNPQQKLEDGERPPDWMFRRKSSLSEDDTHKAVEDREILENIDKEYFVEECDFDSCRYELNKLPEQLNCEHIQQERLKLCQQQKVVSKKVLQLILQKQLACNDEFKRVLLVQEDVGVALRKAAEGRCWLGLARHNLTSASLGILANYKKRLSLTSLLTALHTIKTLHKSEEKAQELLQGGPGEVSEEDDVERRRMCEDGGGGSDYLEAIRLLLECQAAAATFGHFSCVEALSAKLRDTLEMAEEQLDVALAKVCVNYNEVDYTRVQEAWKLVGKTQMAVDQMQMHVSTAVHATAAAALSAHLNKCTAVSTPSKELTSLGTTPGPVDDSDSVYCSSVQHMQYKELCKNVPSDEFLPCLTELCKSLWNIVRSYHHIVCWHHKRTKLANKSSNSEDLPSDKSGDTVEKDSKDVAKMRNLETEDPFDENPFSSDYVMQKLEAGLTRIWNEVQSKICVFLLASDLSWYKFDDFLQVLDLVHRLIEVGEEFCGSKSPELQDSVRAKSLEYVTCHHHTTLDELRIFLENEGWEICPVRPSFSILQLREYRCLRSHFHIQGTGSQGLDGEFTQPHGTDSIKNEQSHDEGYFSRFSNPESGSPFDAAAFADEVQDEDILMDKGEASVYWSDESEDEDEDIPEDMKRDLVFENAGEAAIPLRKTSNNKKRLCRGSSFRSTGGHRPPLPFITNTALTVLRLVGRYIRMACLLRPIAPDVIIRATHLYEYYLFTVFRFFASEVPLNTEHMYSYKLQTLMERIRDKLILSSESERMETTDADKVLCAHISPVVDLSKPEYLYGLAERIAAAESVSFLSSQMLLLQPYLESLLSQRQISRSQSGYHPPKQGTPSHAARHFLTQFYSQTVNVADELRRPIYMCVSKNAINLRQILSLMAQVDWEVPDVMSQHSSYIDILLRELQIFAMRLEEVGSRVPLPSSVHVVLWQQVIGLVCDTFVEGFSNAGRHCSNGGRGLMQLDFTQFLSKVEGILAGSALGGCRSRGGMQGNSWKASVFGTNKERVEAYVKAYYQPENGFEIWIRDHGMEYSQKQLLSLVSCVCQNSKKSRQRLINIVEDMDRGGR